MQAAEEGLTQEYGRPKLPELNSRAVRQWGAEQGRVIGIYTGALGFGYNVKTLAQHKLPEPKCWQDLLDKQIQDEVQVARSQLVRHVLHAAGNKSCRSWARTRASNI